MTSTIASPGVSRYPGPSATTTTTTTTSSTTTAQQPTSATDVVDTPASTVTGADSKHADRSLAPRFDRDAPAPTWFDLLFRPLVDMPASSDPDRLDLAGLQLGTEGFNLTQARYRVAARAANLHIRDLEAKDGTIGRLSWSGGTSSAAAHGVLIDLQRVHAAHLYAHWRACVDQSTRSRTNLCRTVRGLDESKRLRDASPDDALVDRLAPRPESLRGDFGTGVFAMLVGSYLYKPEPPAAGRHAVFWGRSAECLTDAARACLAAARAAEAILGVDAELATPRGCDDVPAALKRLMESIPGVASTPVPDLDDGASASGVLERRGATLADAILWLHATWPNLKLNFDAMARFAAQALAPLCRAPCRAEDAVRAVSGCVERIARGLVGVTARQCGAAAAEAARHVLLVRKSARAELERWPVLVAIGAVQRDDWHAAPYPRQLPILTRFKDLASAIGAVMKDGPASVATLRATLAAVARHADVTASELVECVAHVLAGHHSVRQTERLPGKDDEFNVAHFADDLGAVCGMLADWLPDINPRVLVDMIGLTAASTCFERAPRAGDIDYPEIAALAARAVRAATRTSARMPADGADRVTLYVNQLWHSSLNSEVILERAARDVKDWGTSRRPHLVWRAVSTGRDMARLFVARDGKSFDPDDGSACLPGLVEQAAQIISVGAEDRREVGERHRRTVILIGDLCAAFLLEVRRLRAEPSLDASGAQHMRAMIATAVSEHVWRYRAREPCAAITDGMLALVGVDRQLGAGFREQSLIDGACAGVSVLSGFGVETTARQIGQSLARGICVAAADRLPSGMTLDAVLRLALQGTVAVLRSMTSQSEPILSACVLETVGECVCQIALDRSVVPLSRGDQTVSIALRGALFDLNKVLKRKAPTIDLSRKRTQRVSLLIKAYLYASALLDLAPATRADTLLDVAARAMGEHVPFGSAATSIGTMIGNGLADIFDPEKRLGPLAVRQDMQGALDRCSGVPALTSIRDIILECAQAKLDPPEPLKT